MVRLRKDLREFLSMLTGLKPAGILGGIFGTFEAKNGTGRVKNNAVNY